MDMIIRPFLACFAICILLKFYTVLTVQNYFGLVLDTIASR